MQPGESAQRAPAISHCRRKTAATRCSSRPCAKTSAGITSRAGRSCCVEADRRRRRGARCDRVRVATRGHAAAGTRTARRRAGRSSIPCRTIWRNRSLIRVMVRRDILGRYRGSFGGSFWTVINPLLLMLTYFFVFGVVLRDALRSRPQPVRIRALFPGRDAAVAGFQRSRRTRAQRDAGASQFRQEAGVRGGDAAREPGGVGAGERIVRRGAVLRLSAGAAARTAADACCGCRCCWFRRFCSPRA